MYKGNDENKRKELGRVIMANATQLMRNTQQRKMFINNHPKKIQIARKIIEARLDKKIITFSNNVKMAESIGYGEVYTGRISKKRSDTIIEEFNLADVGVLNTCAKANEGLDVRGLSVAIVLGTDSSETKARQRRGRAVRKEENKVAEIFYIVIKGTTEEKWVQNNHKTDKNYTVIDEEGLEYVLRGEQPPKITQKPRELMFRF